MPHCPICSKPTLETHKPFCSARCQQVDMHRWFSGSYAVPAVELDEEDIEALGLPDEGES
ncbi:MAG: DNA gyrase inhibitor YacG [Rickettsiales bacterium]